MFANFRRYQKWIWGAVIAVVIPSFIVFFLPSGAAPDFRGRTGNYDLGTVNNRPITMEEYLDARQEATVTFFLRFGDWPKRPEVMEQVGFNLDQETYTRIYLVDKTKEMGIRVGPESIAKWINEALMDGNRRIMGLTYEQFVRDVLKQGGVSGPDFERFARNTVGIQQLVALAGASGRLVTQQEAAALWRQDNEEVSTEAVYFSTTNYLASASPTPDELMAFFTNRQADYRLPERVQVNYVKFEATNYLADADRQLAQVTNLNQQLEAAYFRRGTNTFTDAEGKPLPIEAAKEKIKQEERMRAAVVAARRVASEFATVLLEMEPVAATNLQKLAAQRNVSVKVTAPFGFEGPTDIKVPESFTSAAFKLSDLEPFVNSTLPADDGVYIVALAKKYPSEPQTLDQVREKALADYKEMKSQELCQKAVDAFHQSLTNALAQGKGFAGACAEAKVKPVVIPNFSISTRSLPGVEENVSLRQLQNAAMTLGAGKASEVMATRNGYMVLFLRSRLPVDDSRLKAELPAFLARLRQARQGQSFDEWLQRELQAGRLTMPKSGKES